MFGLDIGMTMAVLAAELAAAKADAEYERKMREALSPEAFAIWKADRTAERRHRELCASIERAGRNAKFTLF